jgi:hypothetical protein
VCLPSKGLDREVYDRQLVQELKSRQVELVCLAGFMRLLSAYFVREFPERILNIHPSLLPAFPGLDAQYQALQHGVKIARFTLWMSIWMPGQSFVRLLFLCWMTIRWSRCPLGYSKRNIEFIAKRLR